MAGTGSRDIKRKISSVNSTKQITKAMELVSTAKLKRNRDRLEKTKPYFNTIMDTVMDILKSEKNLKHDFLHERLVRKTLYIVVTGDRGLCGGYNVNVFKEVVGDIEKDYKAKIITVGRKAKEYFENRGYDVEKYYLGISESPEYFDAYDIAKRALKLYREEKVDEIKLVYTEFVSTISQQTRMLKLLPIEKPQGEFEIPDEFTSYEPSPEAVLDYMIPKYIESTIYGALVESSAAEQASRRVAMESATDNAEEMIENLTLSYNQARQAAITQEISEIVSGAEALK